MVSRLNLPALDGVLDEASADGNQKHSYELSRRRVLGLAGAAAVASRPALRALDSSLSGSFSLVRSQGRAVFRYKGEDRWVIDTRLFSGSPRLKVERADNLISLRLTGARFPGTGITADFTAQIRNGITGWRMSIDFASARFKTTVPFEAWLLGNESASALGLLRHEHVDLGDGATLDLGGSGRLSFTPDWSIRLTGKNAGQLRGIGVAAADTVAIRLMTRSEATLIRGSVSRRTLISLSRGSKTWKLNLPDGPEGSRLAAVKSGFDQIDFELRESRLGHIDRAMVAFSARPDVALRFYPSERIKGFDRKAYGLPIRDVRYAANFTSSRPEVALLGLFHDEPTWMHLEGCSVQVGHTPENAGFRLEVRDGKTSLSCAPAIHGVAAGLKDAVVEPQPLARPTNLELVWGRTSKAQDKTAATLRIHGDAGKVVHNLVIPNYVASILRPEDLLALRLEWYGFDLVAGGGAAPYLRRNNESARLVARFAPQNIAEQAFFQVSGNGPKLPPGDPDAGNGNETPHPPGNVQATISGPSRLVFDIVGVTTIPWSLLPVAVSGPPPSTTRKDSGKGASPTGILDWSFFTQRVAPTAQPPGGTNQVPIVQPTADQTDIESPYRLHISPSTYAFWNHTPKLVPGPKGEVELWHTRLGVRSKNGTTHDDNDATDADLRTIRAIWSPDYTTDYNNPPPEYKPPPSPYSPWNPYRASLDANDRYEIVRSTSDYNSQTFDNGVTTQYIPSPVDVDRLALSTLGSWMDFRGHWDTQITTPGAISLVEWKHRSTMARDHYVKVVHAGYLYPFGHKATLVKVTERKFYKTGRRQIVAYLFQHMFIQVRQPVKTYLGPNDPGAPSPPDYPPAHPGSADGAGNWKEGYEGRQMPFKTIEIKSLVTPDIEDPANATYPSTIYKLSGGNFSVKPPNHPGTVQPSDAFWPLVLVGGKVTDFQWHCVGTDWDGNSTSFLLPLIYLDETVAKALGGSEPNGTNYDNLSSWVAKAYKKSPKSTTQMHGSKIAYAPSAPPDPGGKGTDPAVATDAMTFGAVVPPDSVAYVAGNLPPDQPQFYPIAAVANAEIPAIKHLLGKNASSNVAHALPFLQYGFDGNKNKGEVFMHLVQADFPTTGLSQQLPLVFGQGDTGQTVTPGTVSPNLSIAGLSRSIGPVGAKISSGISDFTSIAGGNFDGSSFFADNGGLLGGALPKLFGTVSLSDIIGSLPDFTQYLNKVPGLKVEHTDTEITVHYFWETEQINPWAPGKVSTVADAIFAPWVIDTDGTHTLPMSGGNPAYMSGGAIVSPPPAAAPPPIPEVSLWDPQTDGSVDNSGDSPTHVWVATYTDPSQTPNESIASLGALFDVSQGGTVSGDQKIKVTVAQKNGINSIQIYRSTVGTSWPYYLVGTVTGSDATGPSGNPGTFDFADDVADSDLTNNTKLPSTWAQFGIDIVLTVPLDGGSPSYKITGEVAYASLQMDVIAVPFVSLTFIVQSGQKLTVKPAVNEIVFTNSLKFVNKLRDFLNAFSDPPFLDVTDSEIDAGYTQAIPTISVGVLSLQNIALGAKVTVPFFGDSLAVGFNFCTKDNPFILTVYIFGGGGFFEIDLAPDGLTGLHIGFTFGADFALDIVIASGSVHLNASITYDYDKTSGTQLTAAVDLGGSLDVLGIISVSVNFHLELKYVEDNSGNSSLSGEASLTIEVKIVFFSFSVTLGPIKKTFAGSSKTQAPQLNGHHDARRHSDPTTNPIYISDILEDDTWQAYTLAFAA